MESDGLWEDLSTLALTLSASASLVDASSAPRGISCDAVVRRHGLTAIFSALAAAVAAGEEEHVGIGVACVEALLASPAVVASLVDAAHAAAHVRVALTSPDTRIRLVGCRFVRRLAHGALAAPAGLPRSALLTAGPTGLLSVLVALLADDVTSVAEAAADALAALVDGGAGVSGVSTVPQPRLPGSGAGAAACAAVAVPLALPSPEELRALAGALEELLVAGEADAEDRGSSIVSVRVLALVGRLCGGSDAACAALAESSSSSGHGIPLLRRLISCALDEDDPLLQVNILELLTPLGTSRRGFQELITSRALCALARWAGMAWVGSEWEDADEELTRALDGDGVIGGESDPLLGAAALRTLAGVYASAVSSAWGRTREEAREDVTAEKRERGDGLCAEVTAVAQRFVPALLTRVAEACCESLADPDAAIVSLDALTTAASADVRVVDALLASGDLSVDASAVRQWLELCVANVSQLRHAALGTLASILHAAPVAVAAAGGDAATAEPFDRYLTLLGWVGRACRNDANAAVGDVLASSLRGIGRSASSSAEGVEDPAESARWAAYDVLCALVALPGDGGLRAVFSASGGGMGAALVDPTRERSKLGREWQFAVIDSALRNPACESLGGEGGGFLSALRIFHRRGPHVVGGGATGGGVMTAERGL